MLIERKAGVSEEAGICGNCSFVQFCWEPDTDLKRKPTRITTTKQNKTKFKKLLYNKENIEMKEHLLLHFGTVESISWSLLGRQSRRISNPNCIRLVSSNLDSGRQ